MQIRHLKKTKGAKTEVEILPSAALDPKNIATYTTEKDGKTRHLALGWLLPVAPGSQSYEGHRFELLLSPEELDHWERAIQVAKERFATEQIPGTVTTEVIDVDDE